MNQPPDILTKIKSLNKNQNWQEVLNDWLRTEITYTSNSIEGNTLSLIETSIIINEKKSVAGKTLREINEAINHAQAWDYVTNILSKKNLNEYNPNDLLAIHKIVLNNIDDSEKGKFRNVQVRISGSNTILPNHLKVNELIQKLTSSINNFNSKNQLEIINLAIISHLEMVKIHPFVDGNGRVSRLLMNSILKHYNLPPISVDPKNREQYLSSLEKSDIDNPKYFIDFMMLQYSENLDKYLLTF